MSLVEPDVRRSREFEREALRWLPDIRRYAQALARNETDADDLVQETFTRAFLAWEQYVPGTESRAWLFTICRNAFFRARQRAERQAPVPDAELEAKAAAATYMAAVGSGMQGMFTDVDLRDAIGTAIGDLPEAFREVVMLVDVHDQSYEQAAAVTGVPVGTVRSRLFRARRLLQEALLEHARDAGLVPPATLPAAEDRTP